jgi:hypothetical protein
MSNDNKFCGVCQHLNAATASQCEQCGYPLVPLLASPRGGPSTDPVEVRAAEVPTTPQPAIEIPDLQRGDGLVLVVRGYDEPIFVRGESITLGRYDPGSIHPTIDLTPFNAGAWGVSRQHAHIVQQDNLYLLEDLNSTNGTWINQQRLPPGKRQGLQSGDTLQLGQLILTVYFDTSEAVRAVEEHISLKSSVAQFTPMYLSTRLSPYLSALAEIQGVCDDVLDRQPAIVEIGSISVDPPAIINVQMTGARDALKLAKGQVKSWRSEHIIKVNRFMHLKQELGKQTATLVNDASTNRLNDSDTEVARALGRELRDAEIKLAFAFLRDLAPQYAGADLRAEVEKLLKPLHVLTFSPLQATTGTHNLVRNSAI